MMTATQRRGRGLRGVAWAFALALVSGGCGDDLRPAPDADDVTDVADVADADAADTDPGDVLVDAGLDGDGDVDADDTAADGASDAGDAAGSDEPDQTDAADTADRDAADTEDTGDAADAEDAGDASDAADGADGEVTGPDALDGDDDGADIGDDDGETSDAGPFDDLAALTGAELRAALLDRIDGHTALGYSGGLAREVLWAIVDVRDGRLECIYTGRTVAGEDPTAPPLGTAALPAIDTTPEDDCRLPDGTPVAGGCFFNAEHSWPRSQGADSGPAESDLHHLFPSYDQANNRRSNYAFGETTCVANACEWSEGGSELGARADGTKVFEVRTRHRGDVARAQFYFAVRYQKAIDATVEATLRAWHQDDPPDDDERVRNDAIETWQHNRNPFVDRPDFVAAIADF